MKRDSFKKLRWWKLRREQFQEVEIVENEKGQVSRSLSPKDGVGDRMQKEENTNW